MKSIGLLTWVDASHEVVAYHTEWVHTENSNSVHQFETSLASARHPLIGRRRIMHCSDQIGSAIRTRNMVTAVRRYAKCQRLNTAVFLVLFEYDGAIDSVT